MIIGNPQLIGMADNMLMGRSVATETGPLLTRDQADQYMQKLVVANSIALHSNKPATLRKKWRSMHELNDFMRAHGRNVFEATPQDVKVFVSDWALRSGRYLVGEYHPVAPNSVQGMISNLAMELDRLPWTHGEWDMRTGKGT